MQESRISRWTADSRQSRNSSSNVGTVLTLYLQEELNHASRDLHDGLVAGDVQLAQSLVVQHLPALYKVGVLLVVQIHRGGAAAWALKIFAELAQGHAADLRQGR